MTQTNWQSKDFCDAPTFRYQLPQQIRRSSLQLMALTVLLVAGTLRFSALDRQGLWDDESFTLRALGIIAEPMTMAEGAPPLYFLLLRVWVEIVGTSLASVRAFSALWGTAGVALVGLFAGRAISPKAGLFSAALLSLHPFHLAYSQEARPYAMVFALATITIWMAWEGRIWLFVLASSAVLWTHPWGVFVWLVSIGLMMGALLSEEWTPKKPTSARLARPLAMLAATGSRRLPHSGISVGCLCSDRSGPRRLPVLSC